MIATVLGVLTLLPWIYLLLFHGGFWRADQRLDALPAMAADVAWPEVVAVIPARDEAAVIRASILSHLQSHYPGPFHVVVVDDGSTDGTATIARQTADESGQGEWLTVVEAPPLAEGWSGKLWAIHHGLMVARPVAPEVRYVLLTDADIVHGPNTLARLVGKAENEGRALVSLLARLDDRGPWAGLLIPAFVFFFQKLYPFSWVNDPRRRLAGAAGGSMLIERAALEAEGGVAAVRDEIIDDCAVARLLKGLSPRRPVWLGLAREEVVSLRDNRRLRDIWHMVARTAYTQLRHSPLLLLGTLAGLALLYLLGPALALTWPLHGQTAVGAFGLATWALMTFTYAPTLRLYARPWWQGVALPLAALLYMLMTLDSAWRHWRGRGGRWKGRSYP